MANQRVNFHGTYHERNKYGGAGRQIHPKFHHKLEQEVPIKVNGTLLVGVRKDDRKKYLPNEDGNFTCLDGSMSVAFEKVFKNNVLCSLTQIKSIAESDFRFYASSGIKPNFFRLKFSKKIKFLGPMSS